MPKKIIEPQKGPKAVGPYSPAVVANGFLFVSGQIPLNPDTGTFMTDSFEAQTRQTLNNLKAVIESAGATLDDVVKVTIYLVDISKFGELNQIYEEYFGASKPARACVEVARLPKGADVEMDAIAFIGES